MSLRVEDLGGQEQLCTVKFSPGAGRGEGWRGETLWGAGERPRPCWRVRHRVTSSSQHSRDLPNCGPASPSPGRARMDGDPTRMNNGDPKRGDRKGEEGVP